ncbi:MAG: SUMF1/EgtB/PvdO family nonheme iron enzyme, partial [candidate division WOR-3 bacterium]
MSKRILSGCVAMLGVVVFEVVAAQGAEGKADSRGKADSTPTPKGMTFLRVNDQGYREYLWLKDSSVMILIPAGEFLMGSAQGEGDKDEHPLHKVYVSEFYIDKYEVTNRQYKRFCDATGRNYPPDPELLSSMPNYFNNYPNYPVVNITWEDARAYCDWAGKRLPTEAEWEKAARGSDGRKYPWGNKAPDGSQCNFADRNLPDVPWCDKDADDGYGFTAPVGHYPQGASPYGVLDMAGNVWEWCNDWY